MAAGIRNKVDGISKQSALDQALGASHKMTSEIIGIGQKMPYQKVKQVEDQIERFR